MQTTELASTSDRPALENPDRAIKIQYRDENYGQIYGAVAFRFGSTADLTDDEVENLHAAAQGAGFSFNYQRCAWIREFVYDQAPEAKQALETAISKAGFGLAGTAPSERVNHAA